MVGSGGGQKPPTSASTGASSPRRHHNAACAGAKLNAVDDKENIDPITGLHARLASGASASPRGEWSRRAVVFRNVCCVLACLDDSDARSFGRDFADSFQVSKPSALSFAGARAPAAGSRGVREGAGDEHARKPLADITAAFVRRVRAVPARQRHRPPAYNTHLCRRLFSVFFVFLHRKREFFFRAPAPRASRLPLLTVFEAPKRAFCAAASCSPLPLTACSPSTSSSSFLRVSCSTGREWSSDPALRCARSPDRPSLWRLFLDSRPPFKRPVGVVSLSSSFFRLRALTPPSPSPSSLSLSFASSRPSSRVSSRASAPLKGANPPRR